MGTKICSKCKIEKQLVYFSKQAKSKDGHFTWCKLCSSDHLKIYKQQPEQKEKEKLRWQEYKRLNWEKILEKQKEYNYLHKEEKAAKRKSKRQNNLESVRLRERELYEQNKNEINNRKRKARNNNPELYRKKNRAWYQKNRERIRIIANEYRNKRKEFYNRITAEHRAKNPEYWKLKDKERIENITDGYLRNTIAGNLGLTKEDRKLLTKELLELKRNNIKLKRELKNKKQ